MSRSPGYIARTWQRIKTSFVIYRTTEKYVGEDHLGNRYFEIVKDESSGIKPKRSLKARNEDPTVVPEIPTEWNSWLRGRRKDPPSQEEVDRNYAMLQTRRAKGKEHEIRDRLEAEEGYEDGTVQRAEAFQDKSKFPTYADYEHAPGVTPGKKEDS